MENYTLKDSSVDYIRLSKKHNGDIPKHEFKCGDTVYIIAKVHDKITLCPVCSKEHVDKNKYVCKTCNNGGFLSLLKDKIITCQVYESSTRIDIKLVEGVPQAEIYYRYELSISDTLADGHEPQELVVFTDKAKAQELFK